VDNRHHTEAMKHDTSRINLCDIFKLLSMSAYQCLCRGGVHVCKVKQSNDYVHNQEIHKSLIETKMQVCDNAYKAQQTTKF